MYKKQKMIMLFIVIGLSSLLLLYNNSEYFKTYGIRDERVHVDNNQVYNKDNDNDKNEDKDEDKDMIEEKFKYVKKDLKIREGPDVDKEVLGLIPEGEEIKIIEENIHWDRVEYDGTIGYAANEYLEDLPTIINGIVLVNKEYGVPPNYYKAIDPEAQTYLDMMLGAAKDEEALYLTTHSDYRTHNDQVILFDKYATRHGYESAYKSSAQAGHSEHETGLAFDICDGGCKYYLQESFGESEEGIWLEENAHRFGFILRYPKDKTHITEFVYEPWHFRYIGIDHATEIYERGITLEEYLLPGKY